MELADETFGTGAPVVCLPGFGADRSVAATAFEPVFSARTGWRRIYVDLPGCGDSPAGPATSAGIVDELSAFVDRRCGAEPVLLVGWSYGAYLAAALARRRPADVRGLLLVCPGVRISSGDRDLPEPMAGTGDTGWLDAVPADLHAHFQAALGARTPEVASRVAEVLAASPAGDETYLERLRTSGYRLPDEDVAFSYPGPTLIVTGRQDGVVGYADQFSALSNYPHASFAVLDGAGHYLPFERPEALRKMTLDWLDRIA